MRWWAFVTYFGGPVLVGLLMGFGIVIATICWLTLIITIVGA